VRLRRKLTLAFFFVSSTISLVLAVFLYRFIESQLTGEIHDRLRDIATIGASEIELDSYRALQAQLGSADDDATVAAVEHGDAYKEVSTHLRMLRAAEPSLVHFVYVLAPGDDPNQPRFVADADVLELEALAAAGKPLPKGQEISHFNQTYDISQIPLLERALSECTPQYEPDFVRDEEFGLSSISAYIPISDDNGVALRDANGRCIGVLGIDITDTEMQTALHSARGLAFKTSAAVILVALIVSMVFSSVLTRPVIALSATVRRFAAKDFTARTDVKTRDEIGQLGENFNDMAATIQEHNEHLEDLVAIRTRELVAEKQKSESLLLNVLPAPIAERLKVGENLIVDRFESVSVLFADIVGFTAMSARTSPEQLVSMLNELFSAFDRLAEKHGLEKIKTIGDCYMVVAGIPMPLEDHATAMTRMALDMNATIEAYATRTDSSLAIRIGIHTGSVVAGVIGEKKFIYDLWGDTVNTASRMEHHGVAGRVHVSEAVEAMIRSRFEMEKREPIDVKGKGMMQTYLIVREFAS
jgi:class 3 adenylate cyclase